MVRAVLWSVVAAAACGRWHFDPLADALGSAGRCNLITRFADDFADGVRDPRWGDSYVATGMTATEVNGELVIKLAPNAMAYSGYVTSRFYDLRGARTSVAVTHAAGPAATTGLTVSYDGPDNVQITVQNNMLVAKVATASTFNIPASLPYDAVAQRYVAIEEHDGQVLYEYSADGAAYTTFAQVAAPFDLSLVQPSLFAGTDTPDPAPGEVHFASFNGGTPAAIDACPLASFVDRFDGSVPVHDWNNYRNGCCTETESSGLLQITTDGTVGYAGKVSNAGFDLREGALGVTLATAPTTATFHVSLNASFDSDNQLDLSVLAGNLTALVIVNQAGSPFTSTLLPGEQFMRIRETGGMVIFEISPDKQSWRTLRQLADPFPVDDVVVGLNGGANSVGGVDAAAFANFDVP
jgi:hypothetical protein